MKKHLSKFIIILAALFIPMLVYSAPNPSFAVPWTATSTSNPVISPEVINGIAPKLRDGEIATVHQDGSVTYLQATTSTDVGRGIALMTAYSRAVNGDQLYLSGNTFNVQGQSTLDLSKNGTMTLSIHGAGTSCTGTSSTGGTLILGDAEPVIQPGMNTSVISDMCISALYSGSAPIGDISSTWANSSSTVSNVSMYGEEDGIYVQGVDQRNFTVNNSTEYSNWDTIIFVPNTNCNDQMFVNNNYSYAVASSTLNFGGVTDGPKVAQCGTMTVKNSYAYSAGGYTNNIAYGAVSFANATTTLNLYNDVAVTGGTAPFDIYSSNFGSQKAPAYVNVYSSDSYSPTKISTGSNSNIVFADNPQLRYSLGSSGASSTVLVNENGVAGWQATSSLGFGSGGVTSVSNSNGTLTISPTTGSVVASLNTGHANTWASQQTFGDGSTIDTPVLIQGDGNAAATLRINGGSGFSNGNAAIDLGTSGAQIGMFVNGEMDVGNGSYTDPAPGVSYDIKMGSSNTESIVTSGNIRSNMALYAQGGNLSIGDNSGGTAYIDELGNEALAGNLTVANSNFSIGNTSGGLWYADSLGDQYIAGTLGIATTTPWASLISAQSPIQQSGLKPLVAIASSTKQTLFDILGNGNVGIGTTSPGTSLSIQGVANLSSATSTFNSIGGINLTNGCYAVGGICVGNSSVPHCTTITSKGGTTTVMTNNINVKVHLDTILSDPDNAANIPLDTITVPSWSHNVQVSGHIDWPSQTNGNGIAGAHLFRNGASTGEAFYHVDYFYPVNTSTFFTTLAVSPVIPATPGDVWQLDGFQSSGANVTTPSTPGAWLSVCFYQ